MNTSPAPIRVLLVDDELPIRLTMRDLLQRRQFSVETAANGQEALELIHQQQFEVMLFDLKMPGMDGLEVARLAHERQPDAAILILTGHGSLESALDGIHLGIFDYMLKTTSPQEVVARVQAAAQKVADERRSRQLMGSLYHVVSEMQGTAVVDMSASPPAESWISVGELMISPWRQSVQLGGKPLALTPTEFRVLVCLAQHAGHVQSYQQIIRCAQGYEAEAIEAAELVKPHIYHLRQKIELDSSNPRYILTVRGTGYMLAALPVPPE